VNSIPAPDEVLAAGWVETQSAHGSRLTVPCSPPFIAVNIKFAIAENFRQIEHCSERGYEVNTTKIEDRQERKKLKRAARKKAAPKAKRTTPRGSNKHKVKKLARGQSKR
jgi:hypothetical protein